MGPTPICKWNLCFRFPSLNFKLVPNFLFLKVHHRLFGHPPNWYRLIITSYPFKNGGACLFFVLPESRYMYSLLSSLNRRFLHSQAFPAIQTTKKTRILQMKITPELHFSFLDFNSSSYWPTTGVEDGNALNYQLFLFFFSFLFRHAFHRLHLFFQYFVSICWNLSNFMRSFVFLLVDNITIWYGFNWMRGKLRIFQETIWDGSGSGSRTKGRTSGRDMRVMIWWGWFERRWMTYDSTWEISKYSAFV